MRDIHAAFFLSILAGFALQATAPAAQENIAVDAGDRTGLSLTVYQDGYGIVHDRRRVELSGDTTLLRFEDVARRLMPETVLLDVPGADVLEQSFDFDVLTPQSLIARSVGHEIQVYRPHPETGEDRVETARILSAEAGVVLEIGGRIEILSALPGRLVFPELPEGLHRRPQLSAGLGGARAGAAEVRLTYQSEGLGWSADYVGILHEDETRLALTARAAITNESGLDFEGADIELVAGELQRADAGQPEPDRRVMLMQAAGRAAPEAAEQQPLFGYHLYLLGDALTLQDNETKRRVLFRSPAVTVVKTYRFAARSLSSWDRPLAVALGLDFENSERNGLSRAMPEGVIRLYQAQADGRRRFLGEDRLGPAPADTAVELSLGRAFDVTVTAQAEDRRMIVNTRDRQVYEATQSYRIANAGKQAVTVELEQRIPGRDWEILDSSLPRAEETADSARWQVPVPAEAATTLRFTVRVES